MSMLPGSPRAREGFNSGRREPERVYDTQVLKASLGTGPAKQVLGDLKPGCRLRGGERLFVVVFRRDHAGSVTDHRLTKILVRA